MFLVIFHAFLLNVQVQTYYFYEPLSDNTQISYKDVTTMKKVQINLPDTDYSSTTFTATLQDKFDTVLNKTAPAIIKKNFEVHYETKPWTIKLSFVNAQDNDLNEDITLSIQSHQWYTCPTCESVMLNTCENKNTPCMSNPKCSLLPFFCSSEHTVPFKISYNHVSSTLTIYRDNLPLNNILFVNNKKLNIMQNTDKVVHVEKDVQIVNITYIDEFHEIENYIYTIPYNKTTSKDEGLDVVLPLTIVLGIWFFVAITIVVLSTIIT